ITGTGHPKPLCRSPGERSNRSCECNFGSCEGEQLIHSVAPPHPPCRCCASTWRPLPRCRGGEVGAGWLDVITLMVVSKYSVAVDAMSEPRRGSNPSGDDDAADAEPSLDAFLQTLMLSRL